MNYFDISALGKETGTARQMRIIFWALLCFSLVARVVLSLMIGLRPDPSYLDLGDEREYYELSSNILHGGSGFNLRRPIGYVSYLALLRFVTFDNFTLLQIANAAISSLAAPLTYLLVLRVVGNNPVAVLSALLVALWPPFIFYGSTIYSETATLPLFVLFLLTMPRASLSGQGLPQRFVPWLASGALLGICTIFRPMYLLFLPFALFIIGVEEPRWCEAFRRAIPFVLGFALLLLPYSAYLSIKSGGLVFLSTTGGEVLAQGLNPDLIRKGYIFGSTPESRAIWTGPGKITVPYSDTGYLSEEEEKLPLPQVDALLRQRTIQWVVGNPGQALYLQSAKLAYMWGVYPFFLGWRTVFLNTISLGALCLGIAAVVQFGRWYRHLARFWLLPIYVSGIAMISWGSWRYREPGDLGLLVLCAMFVLALKIPISSITASGEARGERERSLQ